MTSPRCLVLTMGEPAGIGPDVTLGVWRDRDRLQVPAFYCLADPDALRARAVCRQPAQRGNVAMRIVEVVRGESVDADEDDDRGARWIRSGPHHSETGDENEKQGGDAEGLKRHWNE